MTPLAPWREAARGLIPAGFLRRAQREDALFASDYPRRCENPAAVTAALAREGFTVFLSEGIAYLDARPERYAALIRSLPEAPPPAPTEETLALYALALRLSKTQTPPERQPIPPLRLTLKRLDGGEFNRLLCELPPRLSLLQRRREPLPSAAGALIFAALSDHAKGEDSSC